jgi:hypothetical protein
MAGELLPTREALTLTPPRWREWRLAPDADPPQQERLAFDLRVVLRGTVRRNHVCRSFASACRRTPADRADRAAHHPASHEFSDRARDDERSASYGDGTQPQLPDGGKARRWHRWQPRFPQREAAVPTEVIVAVADCCATSADRRIHGNRFGAQGSAIIRAVMAPYNRERLFACQGCCR